MATTEFYISFRKLYDPKQYHARVEVVGRTKHVIRVKVSAGGKEMCLAKYLFRKRNEWKLTDTNFDMYDTGRANLQMLEDIKKAVEEGLQQYGLCK